MIALNSIFNNKNSQYGATMLEVVLAITVVLALSPFLYNHIIEISHDINDMNVANQIVKERDGIINFLRTNQGTWDAGSEIKLTDEELKKIAPLAHAGFVDKYNAGGAAITDVYLAFDIDDNNFRTANIVRHIGTDAAVVRDDDVAYSDGWAVSAPQDFYVGDLIYRISHDFSGADKSKFLHRGTMGEDKLNQMQRNLHMNNFNLYNVGNVKALSAKIIDADAVFVQSDVVESESVYFSSGANMNSQNVTINNMRVTGDVNGFRTITADMLNGDKYTTTGRVITDSATIGNSVNVSNNLILKSTSVKSISGFNGISTSRLLTPYISASNMFFKEGFGITVSGELLVSGNTTLQIGSWVFPSYTPPAFDSFIIVRNKMPDAPDKNEFKEILSENWDKK